MADIVLTTLNAKYAHTAFGLRYLLANLRELRPRAVLLEFDINQRPLDMAEVVLAQQPRIVGLGVYIWNALPATLLAAALKRLAPDVVLVLGGPEISFETEQQEITRYADYVITGEGDLAFAELCRELLHTNQRGTAQPVAQIIPAPLPQFADLAWPYEEYTPTDLTQRVVYVEASRGCPFSCEFCLSSLDIPVRQAPLEPFLGQMHRLWDRGARGFKFVDRTFNLNLAASRAILKFFLDHYEPGMLVHFEMIPDRFPESLRDLIRQFPPGSLQFEVGIQTFNPDVAARIQRRQDNPRAEANLRWLREETNVHIHADLIVGLPGESLESFAAGFDRLAALRPHEIQVGILKRLRGTPISRHDAEWQMVYSPYPPYEILQNKLIDFATMQQLRRFARYWDLVANSGRFRGIESLYRFEAFWDFSNWLYRRVGRTYDLGPDRLGRLLQEYLGRPVEIVGRGEALRQRRFISGDGASADIRANRPPQTAAPTPATQTTPLPSPVR
ncbi:MAG: DUF4080 domain-containing protein [Verrucomicrobiae bacterium]|nr:DUF4080 domain-containing protein [Verrucomicrobiae bacterium]